MRMGRSAYFYTGVAIVFALDFLTLSSGMSRAYQHLRESRETRDNVRLSENYTEPVTNTDFSTRTKGMLTDAGVSLMAGIFAFANWPPKKRKNLDDEVN